MLIAASRVIHFRERFDCRCALLRLGGSLKRRLAQEPEERAVPGQLAAIEAETRWLRRTVQLQSVMQRSLVNVALSLQQAKGEAFCKLRQFAACQAWNASDRAFPMVRRRFRPTRPSVEYAAQTRVISARWMSSVLMQARLRLAGGAWQKLAVNAALTGRFALIGLGAEGFECAGRRKVLEQLARDDGIKYDIGLALPIALGPARACTDWVC